MLQKGLSLRTQSRIGVQTLFNKRVELEGPFLWLLKALGGLFLELEDSHIGFYMRIGDYSLSQFDGGHAQRPDIGLIGILTISQDFWTHPVGRAYL